MKWRSVEELPKVDGVYCCLSHDIETKKHRMGYSCFDKTWGELNSRYKVMAWLDPEVPEEFLKPMPEPVKCCPWCYMNYWEVAKIDIYQTYYYRCYFAGCGATGPQRETIQEAEAAIFERVR